MGDSLGVKKTKPSGEMCERDGIGMPLDRHGTLYAWSMSL